MKNIPLKINISRADITSILSESLVAVHTVSISLEFQYLKEDVKSPFTVYPIK